MTISTRQRIGLALTLIVGGLDRMTDAELEKRLDQLEEVRKLAREVSDGQNR